MLTEKDFIATAYNTIDSASFEWSAPSNIALVKYWGKKELVIKKEGQGDYIKEIRLGNKKINKYLISHDDLIKAGEITFIVTENPNKK